MNALPPYTPLQATTVVLSGTPGMAIPSWWTPVPVGRIVVYVRPPPTVPTAAARPVVVAAEREAGGILRQGKRGRPGYPPPADFFLDTVSMREFRVDLLAASTPGVEESTILQTSKIDTGVTLMGTFSGADLARVTTEPASDRLRERAFVYDKMPTPPPDVGHLVTVANKGGVHWVTVEFDGASLVIWDTMAVCAPRSGTLASYSDVIEAARARFAYTGKISPRTLVGIHIFEETCGQTDVWSCGYRSIVVADALLRGEDPSLMSWANTQRRLGLLSQAVLELLIQMSAKALARPRD